MYLPLLILIVIIAFALILIIMVQNPKGGGLSSSFGGNANTIGGVQNTNNFLDKATWVLAIALFGLILLSRFTIDSSSKGKTSTVEEKTTEMNDLLKGVKTNTDKENIKSETPVKTESETPATEN